MNGVPVQGNFDTYRMVRLAEAPKIDVHLVPSGGPASYFSSAIMANFRAARIQVASA
jgi:CO/xanthine dehydrogenase Mo-binding subunit